MNGRTAKKIRKEINHVRHDAVEGFRQFIKALPFRKRMKLTWRILINKF